LGQFRGEAALGTWLLTLARHACSRHFRKSKFAPTSELSLDESRATGSDSQLALNSVGSPESEAGLHQLSAAVSQAISELEPDQREVLVLRDIDGLSANEVAEVTGASVAAVKSRLHRARRWVRDRALVIAEPKLGAPLGPLCTPDCPDILQLFSQQLEGDVSPDLCARIQDHVDQCPACSATCDSLKQTLAVCQAVPLGPVPERVQNAVRAIIRAPSS
jgi:RNA polymerase sigma-70 factor (ECF subfamily)